MVKRHVLLVAAIFLILGSCVQLTLAEEAPEAQEALAALTKEAKRLKADVGASRKEAETLKTKLEETQTALKAAEAKVQKHAQLEEELKGSQSVTQQQLQEIQTLKAKAAQAEDDHKSKLVESDERVNKLLVKIQALDKEKNALKEELKQAKQEASGSSDAVENELAQLKSQLYELAKELDVAKSNEEEAKTSHEKLQTQIDDLSGQLESAQNTEEQLKATIAELTSQLDEHQKEVLGHKEHHSEEEKMWEAKFNEAEARLKALEGEKTECAAKVSTCDVNTNQKQNQIDDLTKRLAATKSELDEAVSRASTAEEDYAKKIKRLEGNVKKSKDEAQAAKEELKEATNRADESSKALQELQYAMQNHWLPFWMAQRLEFLEPYTTLITNSSTFGVVSNYTSQAIVTTSAYTKVALNATADYCDSARVRAGEVWEQAVPAVAKAYEDSMVFVQDVGTTVKPHLLTAADRAGHAWEKAKSNTVEFLRSEGVQNLRHQALAALGTAGQHARMVQHELESLLAVQLRKVDALRGFADPPFITYVTWLCFAGPMSVLFIALSAIWTAGKRKQDQARAVNRATRSRTVSEMSDTGSDGNGKRKKKAKRVSQGGESVLYA